MTDAVQPGQRQETTSDPFVVQVHWLIGAVGGKDRLVARSGNLVSARTLDNWTAGIYPRNKVTGAVRALDTWAAENVPGYPEAAGVPRLVDSAGPYRPPVVDGAAAGTPADADPADADPAPRPAPRRWLRRLGAAAAMVVIAAASSITTALVVHHEDAAAGSSTAADDQRLARLPLPSTGNGKVYTEQAGHIGANTFQDPRTLAGRGAVIPPHGTVQVRCRYYAPSVPSVSPDGFWYLIDSQPYNGTWTPANSFMNGDKPGGPYLHNTDLAVPICR